MTTQSGARELTFMLAGDVMLGRLVDQIMPVHVYEPEEQFHAINILRRYGKLEQTQHNPYAYVWGDILPDMLKADARLINLETSITASSKKWPNKAFNYRMHPHNVNVLTTAKIDYCSLANNHILDFGEEGLKNTVEVLKSKKIAYAGVGNSWEEASRPAILNLHGHKVACFRPYRVLPFVKRRLIDSLADYPPQWAAGTGSGMWFLSPEHRNDKQLKNFKEAVKRAKERDPDIDMIIVSFHWGPNYAWEPSQDIQSLAHELISECDVDLIHGHSAHHIQGIEIFNGKPILYGCGDFVDDYAVDEDFRNDLGFAYFVTFDNDGIFQSIELVPTKIEAFQVSKKLSLPESKWIKGAMKSLCKKFGTTATELHNGNLLIAKNE